MKEDLRNSIHVVVELVYQYNHMNRTVYEIQEEFGASILFCEGLRKFSSQKLLVQKKYVLFFFL